MQNIDIPLNPRQRKQASVKRLSRFQELVAEYQSSSSSTACNKMTEQDPARVLLQYLLDECRQDTASSSSDKDRENDAKWSQLTAEKLRN